MMKLMMIAMREGTKEWTRWWWYWDGISICCSNHKVFTMPTMLKLLGKFVVAAACAPLPKGQSAKQQRSKKEATAEKENNCNNNNNKHKICQFALETRADWKGNRLLLARWLPGMFVIDFSDDDDSPAPLLLFLLPLPSSCFKFRISIQFMTFWKGNRQLANGSPLGSSFFSCWNQSQHNVANYGASSLTFALTLHAFARPECLV